MLAAPVWALSKLRGCCISGPLTYSFRWLDALALSFKKVRGCLPLVRKLFLAEVQAQANASFGAHGGGCLRDLATVSPIFFPFSSGSVADFSAAGLFFDDKILRWARSGRKRDHGRASVQAPK